MPPVPSNAMALKNAKTIPSIGSLLISAASGFDECCLCGNSFDIGKSSKSTRNHLPCVDTHCKPCAGMWRILSSPTCQACYADFICPQVAKDRAHISLPQTDLDANNTLQKQSPSNTLQVYSPSNSQIESPLGLQERYVAFYGADADSDEDTISDSGSPMREGGHEMTAVSKLEDEPLREALILANNRAGTNFNIKEIEDGIPLAVLRTVTKTQLADTLTQFCVGKSSESDEDVGRDGNGNSQQPDEDDSSDAISQQDEETALEKPFRCIRCQRTFRIAGHLRQHMVVHTVGRRTCSICGKVLQHPNSRRIHEKLHLETDSERDERLRKAKVAREQSRTGQKGPKRYRPERVPQALG
ncbi:MAG: hypothetical protein Q9175_005593 [Cornicularia normoerica]